MVDLNAIDNAQCNAQPNFVNLSLNVNFMLPRVCKEPKGEDEEGDDELVDGRDEGQQLRVGKHLKPSDQGQQSQGDNAL
jgi:hypothetical protein